MVDRASRSASGTFYACKSNNSTLPTAHDEFIPSLRIPAEKHETHHPLSLRDNTAKMALDNFYNNKIESMKLEIIQGQAVLRRLEAQRNEYNSRVRLLREELGLLQQPGSYVGEVVKVMGTKKVLVKVHPEGKYGMSCNLSPMLYITHHTSHTTNFPCPKQPTHPQY